MLIGDILGVFKQGKALKDKEVWKSRVALGNALAGLLSALAGVLYAFGVVHVQVDSETVQAIAFGVASAYGLANSIMHVATSETAGVPSAAPANSFPTIALPDGTERPNADAVQPLPGKPKADDKPAAWDTSRLG